MKKLFFLLFLPAFMALASCGGSSSDKADGSDAPATPKAAVEKMFKALKNLDAKEMAAACCDKQGKPFEYTDEEIKAAQEEVNNSEMKTMVQSFEYTITDEEIDEDGKTATVHATMKMGGEEGNRRFICIKGEDGVWRVADRPF